MMIYVLSIIILLLHLTNYITRYYVYGVEEESTCLAASDYY